METQSKPSKKLAIFLWLGLGVFFIWICARAFSEPVPSSVSPASTATIIPTSIPTTIDKSVVGIYYDDYAPSLPYTLVLKNINGTYYKTEIYSDNSQQTIKLILTIVNGKERYVEEGDDGYFGEYMTIGKDGLLSFYDKQGIIYRLHPE